MNVSGTENRTPAPSAINAHRVIAGFQNDGNEWLTSGEIAEKYVPDLTPGSRYNLIHRMADPNNGMLERRSNAPGEKYDYHYRLSPHLLQFAPEPPQTAGSDEKAEKRPYVRWTPNEKMLVVKRAFLLRRTGTTSGLKDALEKAQHALIAEGTLGSDRYRNLSTTHHLSEIRVLMDDLAKQGYKGEGAPEPAVEPVAEAPVETKAPEQPIPEPAPELVQRPQDAVKQFAATHHHKAPADGTAALLSILFDRLGHSATKVLANAVEYGLTRAFRSIMATEKGEAIFNAVVSKQQGVVPPTPVQRHNPLVVEGDRIKLKKVLIMGLRPNEMGVIDGEFKGAFDLRYWSPGQAHHLLRTLVKNVDTSVVMTDRLRHSDAELVTHANVPFVPSAGGVSQLKDVLTKMYVD